MKTHRIALSAPLTATILGALIMVSPRAFGHCDTMDGPVVRAAKAALETKDITPVLKWVNKDNETQIKTSFALALAVRTKGPEAQHLADQFFFETLVRIHRAGEGVPFTGLKPSGTPLALPIREADNALESGSADQVVKLVADEAVAGIRKRFAAVQEKKRHAEDNVEAGRDFVAAYVEYVHYIEGLYDIAQSGSAHQGTERSFPLEHQTHQHAVH